MARPTDWTPLGCDSDPVPGDPGQISQEAAHLSSVARQIADQVAALRQMATGGVEVGQHAEKIRSSAGDLAGQLDKVVGRYQKVSAALTQWVPDLEQAQAQSLTALNEAEGPYQKLNTPVVLPSGPHLTAAQKQSVTAYHTSMNQAQQSLDAAKALLAKAVSFRDERASYYAGVISKAVDDGVADSWWDRFKEWVNKYAWLIKDVCTALEIAATALAILALIFTGVGWIVLLGIGLTALALLGRGMLAATGNGSWFDVGVDAFALLTFGAGAALGKVLSTVTENTATLARGMESAKAADLLSSFAKVAGQDAAQRVSAQFLERVVPEVSETAKTTLWERVLWAGDRGVVNNMKTNLQLYAKFGSNPAIAALTGQSRMLANLLRGNFAAANAVGLGSLAGGGIEIDGPGGPTAVNWHIPGVTGLYTKVFEDTTTQDGGISTAAADHLERIASVISPVTIPAFQLATGTW
jgi:hypothetical protein